MHQILDHTIFITQASLLQKLSDKQINALVNALQIQEKKFAKNSTLFMIDADATAGLNHFLACSLLSLKAFEQKNNLSKSLAAEIMLYLSGYRQISKALLKVGLSSETTNILMIQITRLDPNSKDDIPFFDYQQFIADQDIKIKDYIVDTNEIILTTEKKVMFNLEISDNNIELLMIQGNQEYTREKSLEKLAIEKSALLNLLK